MSFPVNIHGNYGDEKNFSSTRIGNLPLGTRMILPDGRIFAHAKCSSTAAIGTGLLTIGADIASSAWVYDLGASAAVNSNYINVTLTATGATTVDQFRDGFIFVNDDNGKGHVYKVASNDSAAVSTTCKFTLEDNDDVKVLLKVGSSEVGIKRNVFDEVIVRTAGTTAVNIPTGVMPVAVTAGYYFWLQRRGECCVRFAGTSAAVGVPCVAATVTAGGVQSWVDNADTTLSPANHEIGYCIQTVAATTEYGFIYLTLD